MTITMTFEQVRVLDKLIQEGEKVAISPIGEDLLAESAFRNDVLRINARGQATIEHGFTLGLSTRPRCPKASL